MILGRSFFIGQTLSGRQPVFFGPHTPIINNMSPVTIVTGSPGSGKTYTLMGMYGASSSTGDTTIAIDAKADFLSLHNIRDEIGDVKIWNITDSSGAYDGILDPFSLSTKKDNSALLALNTVDLLLGGMTDEERTSIMPVLKDVSVRRRPSLTMLMEELESSSRPKAREIATKLRILSEDEYASLCFAPNVRKKVDIKGSFVITMSGLELPESPDVKKSEKQRLGEAILHLTINYVKEILDKSDASKPKTLIIDEAWRLLNNAYGLSLIRDIGLLGRSKFISLILATQEYSHFEKIPEAKTFISTKFAFRAGNSSDAMKIVKDMGIDSDEGLLIDLPNGYCLMQDFTGRVGLLKIILSSPTWGKKFNTNPLTKKQKK